ncbi:4-hydroxy-3-methylbut-2-enyl diphosphate reductase [Candidatus Desulfarcum epimagneticum]|uniref:4-hydroxy-3-methylbut-2-enyl diphosphate reductase n=1 Tax=uncultured Desulfobacteraceae bacterium TaxID=218296 RepID=A0A484HK65_9BACT|nr:4-hydroxy-3-methylbut-2-enyl diphosphate reductase [uncultured Desulfobacteraceae bacterium]
MNIRVAKTAGFCMGVRRAVDLALETVEKHGGTARSFGPLIHNSQVLEFLKERGVRVLDDIPKKGSGAVIIRAHGVPPQTRERLSRAGFNIVDATCPRVIKVQTIIETHAARGHAAIIAGDRDHPEVSGLLGYSDGQGHVIDSLESVKSLPVFEKAIIVAQTTQNIEFYDQIKKWAAGRRPHYKIFDTICHSTARRQNEVRDMARRADIFVVVGGKNSGNTRRLAEVARESGKPARHIETEAELDPSAVEGRRNVCVTAGASTPDWIIERVVKKIESPGRG